MRVSSSKAPVAVNVPPGTVIANVIGNIINGDHITRPDWALTLELIMILIFGPYVALVIPQIKAGISAAVSLVLLLAWMIAAIYLFAAYGYWVKALYPALLLLIGYIVIVSKRYLLTEKAKDRMEADSVETNKMLGLSFQGQGLLDMAFDKFRKCPVEDESVKDLLYNLGLDFERKRMFNKAVAVYQHIAQAGAFKDIDDRIKKLTTAGETMIFGLSGAKKEATVIMDNTEIKPTLGRYEIVKELGRGAMGTVFLGKDPRINREVAIKTLRYEEIDAEQIDEVKKRFFREAEAAGSIDQLTDDHSMAQEQVKRNLITQEEADQSEMKNILTKALGIQPEMEADLDELTVMDGDILLLCTGGFSNMVTDDDALDIISSAQNASAACESMIDAANRNGGKDNITVVIGYVWKEKWYSALMKFMEFFRR